MRVFVTGGSGYVGQPIVQLLLQEGHEVRILVRTKARPVSLHPHLVPVDGDLFSQEVLSQGMKDCDAVIHLVGIIRESPRQQITMHRIHTLGTQSVLTAAKKQGIARFLHMSALGSREDAISAYHKSKWAAEQLVRKSELSYTIFRPSVVYGKGGPGPHFIRQLAQLIQSAPIVPMLGDGHARLQPVSVQSLAAIFSSALTEAASIGRTYEVGGAEVVTYQGILQTIAKVLHRRLRTLKIPMSLAEQIIPWLQHLPKFPITQDQLLMLKEGNVCSDGGSVYRELGLEALPFYLTAADM